MSVLLVLILVGVVYVLPGLLVGARIATVIAWNAHVRERAKWPSLYNDTDYDRQHGRQPRPLAPSGDNWFGGFCMGAMAAVVWPAVLLGYAFRSWLFAPPREVRERQQAERIADLERELELRS